MNAVPGRNDPCPCGSGKKYKHCCIGQSTARKAAGDDANQHVQSAFQHHQAGRLQQAEATYRRALQLAPNHPDALYLLGMLSHQMGKNEAALDFIKRAIRGNPADPYLHDNLGLLYKARNQPNEAEASYRRALEIKPDFAEAHYNLGVNLQERGRTSEAEASYRRALQFKPDYADAHYNLGTVLQDQGRLSEAEASYRRVLALNPSSADAYSNLLFCLSHDASVNAQTLFSEHCRFGEQFEAPLRASWPQHTNSRDPKRSLRIGVVSADLYNHAVAFFIEPVLAHLSNDPQLSLHAYYNHVAEDDVTRRLRGYFAHWHAIAGLSDDALAKKVRADSIDILIDLSGHTNGNRLLTFARKPAPVQASWMGYPGTTGLRAMDYYFADRLFLPREQFAKQFTEEFAYLPAVAPFMPSTEAPPVSALPALANGYLTFGSFNRQSKISRSVVALWARLLRALPDSRMLLGGMLEDGRYDMLIDWFAQESVAQDRLDFHARSGVDRYLRLHQHVDICLDAFPYSGGTTSGHALWMGVPTLTLAGDTPAGRTGALILGHAGLDAFIAKDADDFVHKGAIWSGRLQALADLRAGLRERITDSAMGQPALVAAGLQRALRIMWERWCAGLPAESFEVSAQAIGETMQMEAER